MYLLQAPGLAVDLNRFQMLEEYMIMSELYTVQSWGRTHAA